MTQDINFCEDEDDWFFKSIMRYDHLFMYDFDELKNEEEVLCVSISPSGDRWALLTSSDLRVYGSPSSLKPSGVKFPKRDVPLLAGASHTSSSSFKFVAFLTEDELITPLHTWKVNETDLLQRGRDLSLQDWTLFNVFNSRIVGISKNTLYLLDSNSDSKLVTLDSEPIVGALNGERLTILKKNGSVWTDDHMAFQLELPKCSHQMTLLSPIHVFVALLEESAPRSAGILYQNGEKLFDIKDEEVHGVCLSPCRGFCSFISSGSTIKVYSLLSHGQEVFKHDGHKHSIVSHTWHPTIPNTIYSLDKEKNVHIWKFKVSNPEN